MQSTCEGHLATFAYNNVPKIIKSTFVCTHMQHIDSESVVHTCDVNKSFILCQEKKISRMFSRLNTTTIAQGHERS